MLLDEIVIPSEAKIPPNSIFPFVQENMVIKWIPPIDIALKNLLVILPIVIIARYIINKKNNLVIHDKLQIFLIFLFFIVVGMAMLPWIF